MDLITSHRRNILSFKSPGIVTTMKNRARIVGSSILQTKMNFKRQEKCNIYKRGSNQERGSSYMRIIRWKKYWKDKTDGETKGSWYLNENSDGDTLGKIFRYSYYNKWCVRQSHYRCFWMDRKTENPKYCMDDGRGFMKGE